MGGRQSSPEMEAEMQRWDQVHELDIDEQLQAQNLSRLSLGRHLKLGWVDMTLHSPKANLRHYFITDGQMVIEFGAQHLLMDGGQARVHARVPRAYRTERAFKNSRTVQDRISEVAGARNYCLLTRNSEHFARYIAGSGWTSMMTVDGSPIHELFKNQIARMRERKQTINQPPRELRKVYPARPLYAQEERFIRAREPPGHMLSEEDVQNGFNIVFLGPTGSGKSRLINLLFNMQVVRSAGGATSVTQEMQVIQGTAEIHGEAKLVNVVDTIGFCDTNMTPSDLHRLIKQYIKARMMIIHKVVIVCAGRLELEHKRSIEEFLSWLKYSRNPECFGVVYTKCEDLDAEERYESLCNLCRALGIQASSQRLWDDADFRLPSSVLTGRPFDPRLSSRLSVPYNLAVGFHPSAPYADIEEDLHSVVDMIGTSPREPLRVDASACSIL